MTPTATSIKRLSRLAVLLPALATTQLAAAQSPWVTMPSAPNFVSNPSPKNGYPDILHVLFSAPAPNTLWGVYTSDSWYGGSTLYRTTDNGQLWQTGVAASQNLNGAGVMDISALDAQTAWVLNHRAGLSSGLYSLPTLLRTYTGPAGLVDITSSSFPEGGSSLHFFNVTTGICVTSPAAGSTSWEIYRTVDGGTTWTHVPATLPVGTTSKYYDTSHIGKAAIGATLWLGTEDGDVLRTTDGGLTWSQVPRALGAAISGLVFRDALHRLAYSQQGELARTTDGGATWQRLPKPWSADYVSLVVQPGTSTYLGVAATQATGNTYVSSRLAVSTDDGNSWQTQLTGDVPYRQLAMSPDGQLWAATFRPYVATPFPVIIPHLYNMLLRSAGTALASQPVAASGQPLAYPNPTTGFVQLPTAPGETVRVHDTLGRQYACPMATGTLDFSAAPAGIYLITITSAAGTTATQRLSVVH